MAHLALAWIKIWITQIDSVYRPCTARGLRSIDSIDESRITRDEHALWSELWTLHIGTDSPSPKEGV